MTRADPFARVGLELELLAPPRMTRASIARHLARRLRGRVEHGFKYYSEGQLPDGRPLCLLSDASRVVDGRGHALLTLVDDNTIRDELPTRGGREWLLATDDVRLALWFERHSWSKGDSPEARLEFAREAFSGSFEEGALFDAYGHRLVTRLTEAASHRRVCEVVTRVLTRAERARLLVAVCEVAQELGLVIPQAAALHAHYDAAPWKQVRALSRLVLRSTSERATWMNALRPNARCKKLGPFPDAAVQVAQHAPGKVGWGPFAAALHLAGVQKACDFNIRGVIERYPRHPTLEVRCLPMSLHASEVLERLGAAEALLGGVLAGP